MKTVNCQITHTQVAPHPPTSLITDKECILVLMICEKVTPRMDSGLKTPVVSFGHIPNAYLKPMGPEK